MQNSGLSTCNWQEQRESSGHLVEERRQYSLGKAMEQASTLQCAVRCGCAACSIWHDECSIVQENCNPLRAHAEVVDVIRPSQSISLLATHLSAVSNNMRYSLATMSTDFGAANCCIRTEANKLYTLSSLAHSTHGIKFLEQIDPQYHLSLTPWPSWPGSCIYLAWGPGHLPFW